MARAGQQLPRPADTRPYVPMHASGHEIRTRSDDGTRRHRWRQVGWQGQTGALYGLGEKPSEHEPGSFSPMYVMVDSDPLDLDDEPRVGPFEDGYRSAPVPPGSYHGASRDNQGG